jgi:pimeloyl-ACP methyl ester carboxylesterase
MFHLKTNEMRCRINCIKTRICGIFLSGLFFNISGYSQPKTIQLMTPDKVVVTADLYMPNPENATFIILCHQANYSRGEYIEIAPKLNALGYNCMAVDLRSGDEINGIENQTFKFADSLKMQTRYTDAYLDMKTSLSYIRNKYPTAKVILFGSAYSGSLALKMAGDNPAGIAGVIAFSPGEYFSAFGWNRDIIQTSSSRIKCPVFITSARSEEDQWRKIYNAIPVQTKVSFLPTHDGKNGAKVLWSAFPESEEYWMALKNFLAKYYPKGR